MNRNGGKIILWGLILAMLVFTATRTLHFLQMTFPIDQQYIAYLGLAAFDIGILGWLYYATKSAEGREQRTIAYGMIFVCMAGALATTIADMVIVANQNGLTKLPPQWGTLGLWGVIIVISLNVMAGVLVHLVDPSHQKHMAMETARDAIHATTMEHIRQQAHAIAPQIASQVSAYWAQQTVHEMTGQIPGMRSAPSPQLPNAKTVDASNAQPASFAQTAQPSILARNDQETGPLQGSFPPVSEAHYRQLFNMWAKETQQPGPLSQPLPENDQQASQ